MGMTRRDFCITAAAATVAPALPAATPDRKVIWANLVHLGVDMWVDHDVGDPNHGPPSELRCDEAQWREITARMHEKGLNTLLVDLAEGMVFPSHPDLAVKGAWSPDKMRDEIARLKALGITAMPKINFSTCHDSWFKDYGRMVSTKPYYDFCRDIIRDAAEIFKDAPLFHIGMDEEEPLNQKKLNYCVSRQGDLWWHDLHFIADAVAKTGHRPWMWSDYAWNHPDYYKRCSRDIVQSNWYYSASFDKELLRANRDKQVKAQEVVQMYEIDQVECYEKLDKAGFDQIPCGGNWREDVNLAETVKFCREHVAPERLKGFLATSWRWATPPFREYNLKCVDQLGAEVAKWRGQA